MAIQQVSGSDFINSIASDTQNDATFYLRSYLSFGSMTSESWNTQAIDDSSNNNSGNWKSTQGSVLSFKDITTGTDIVGKNSGLFSAIGKTDGIKVSANWNDSWTASTYSEQKSVAWSYVGDTKTTTDDFSYKLNYSATHSDSRTAANSRSATVDFSNSEWSYKYIDSVSGIDAKYKGSGSINLLDKNDKTSFSASYTFTADLNTDTVNMTLSNVKYILSDYTITTAKYTEILSYAQFDQLPQISPENGLSLSSIKSNLPSLQELLADGSGSFVITTKNGAQIDTGAGNDTVTGGIGNDVIIGGLGNDAINGGLGADSIIGGAGSDKLTGSKGDDVFKLSKSDFDFTSAKTVLADTITDFKYTATEKDSIALDGFGSVGVFQTIALAKKSGSTANVIYESKTGNFWYNEDGDSALAGVLLFANAKGIPDSYWVAAGVM